MAKALKYMKPVRYLKPFPLIEQHFSAFLMDSSRSRRLWRTRGQLCKL